MLRAAVVPNGERANLPAEPAGELRLHRMASEEIENGSRLPRLEAIEALRVIAEIERLAARVGVGANQGMRGLGYEVARILDLRRHFGVADRAALARCRHFVRAAKPFAVTHIEGPKVLDQRLNGLGQGLIRQGNVGKKRIALRLPRLLGRKVGGL